MKSSHLVLLLPLCSCGEPLKEAQLLEEPRILGARVATRSGQASPAPGEAAAFEVLLAGPDGNLEAQLAYRFCAAQSSTRGVPFCSAPAFAEGTVDLDGSPIAITIPSELASGAPLALLAVACLASEPRLSGLPLDWTCAGDEPPLRFSFDARAGGAAFGNANPDLSTLTVSIDGIDLTLDEPNACEAGGTALAAGVTHRLAIELPSDAREAGETLQLSHFSTRGALERQYSFVEAADQPKLEVTWRAPDTAAAVQQFLVVRDGRGGVSWASWSFCTR